jgi:hypothetical protein
MFHWITKLKDWNSNRLTMMEERRWRKWEVSETGMIVSMYRKPTVQFSWDEVDEIASFKRDLYIHDQICLSISIKGQDTKLSIEEDNPNWVNVVKVLESRFSLSVNWQGEVMNPAFETKWTVLWPKT